VKTLKLGPGFSIPLGAVTETFGLLAVRGAGKTNAARVMAEEMFATGLPFVAVDPVGSWWGLRAGRGGAPGLAIPIFGGKRGDVPLERGGGELLADLVVAQRLSCVLDLSAFESEAAKKEFLLAFARRLYLKNEEPLHLFLEEADDYIPQRPMRDEAQLLRAWENLVRRGRARGIGLTLITQRSASINKNVLTQVGTLIALRTTGPQDRAAIEDWLKYNAQSREILASLAGLDNGEAWVWSPQFLGKTERVRFRLSTTEDSGATPTGKKSTTPSTLADVDLADIQKRMAATIERAKESDPKELHKRIRTLEQELRAAKAAQPPAPKAERVEVPVMLAKDLARLDSIRGEIEKLAAKQAEAFEGMRRGHLESVRKYEEIGAQIQAKLDQARREGEPPGRYGPSIQILKDGLRDLRAMGAKAPASPVSPQVMRETRRAAPADGVRLGAGERKLLGAIAQHSLGVTREQLTVLTGYKRSSRDTYLQRLRAADLIVQVGDVIAARETAAAVLGPDFEPLPTGDELRVHWLERLSGGEQRLLALVCDAYPKAISREELSRVSGYQRSSRDTYLQRLRVRRLIVAAGSDVKAAEELFG
jgi:hypothetical protein